MKDQAVLYPPGANDECYTPAYAVQALVPWLPSLSGAGDLRWPTRIWCPFDTEESEFVRVLRSVGYKVIHSHIRDGQDFYSYEPDRWDIMVSNPPFTNKRKIFERALSFNRPFALLMSLTWLNDSAPKELFWERPLELLMFKERIQFKGQAKKVTFSSAYFCSGLLPRQICMASLKPYL